MRRSVYFIIAILTVILFSSCEEEKPQNPSSERELSDLIEGEPQITLNPSGMAPLTASIRMKARNRFIKIDYAHVVGTTTIKNDGTGLGTSVEAAVIGLYAGRENRIALRVSNVDGLFAIDTLKITTPALPEAFPSISIIKKINNLMEPGLHFVEVQIARSADPKQQNSVPIVFDNEGEVRWFLDFSDYTEISSPIRINSSDEVCFVGNNSINKLDLMGSNVGVFSISGFECSNVLHELPNGNYLLGVTKPGKYINSTQGSVESVNDHVIEVSGSNVVNEWDLAQVLDVARTALSDGGANWFDINALWDIGDDNGIIVSGRNQGIVKLDSQGNLVWILAPHKDWGAAGPDGSGFETDPFLLTATDGKQNPTVLPENVQQGTSFRPDFEWIWGQSSFMVMSTGNLLVMDNGLNRLFGATGQYSRAVEYVINEGSKRVHQNWTYGRIRGTETYSEEFGSVYNFGLNKTVLFVAGATNDNKARIIEINYPGDSPVFEAVLSLKNQSTTGDNGDYVRGAQRVLRSYID